MRTWVNGEDSLVSGGFVTFMTRNWIKVLTSIYAFLKVMVACTKKLPSRTHSIKLSSPRGTHSMSVGNLVSIGNSN